MSRRLRLDAELVRRQLTHSREEAGRLIGEGQVWVAGQQAAKAATQVTTDAPIVVRPVTRRWVSRGAIKLHGALEVFEPAGLRVAGRRCLDAGASTGGFTEVLVERGAAEVVAVDVAYGELAWTLRDHARVDVRERTNIRHLRLADIGSPVDLVVSDLSFLSLTAVLGALTGLCRDDGDVVAMIKPQFEVGPDRVGPQGVVREPRLHHEAVADVLAAAYALGWGTRHLAPSQLPGPAGNVEYFCWLRTDAQQPTTDTVAKAVAAGTAMQNK